MLRSRIFVPLFVLAACGGSMSSPPTPTPATATSASASTSTTVPPPIVASTTASSTAPPATSAPPASSAPPAPPPPGSLLATLMAHNGDRVEFDVDAYVLAVSLFDCTCPPHAECGTCPGSYLILGAQPDLDKTSHGPDVIHVDAPARPEYRALAIGSKHTFTLQSEAGHPLPGGSDGRFELVRVK